jgi:hypothetical protein
MSNVEAIQNILTLAEVNEWHIDEVLYSLGCNLLYRCGILDKSHVKRTLQPYSYTIIPQLFSLVLPQDEWDLLGLVYQSSLAEGKKNATGSYYTPRAISANMLNCFEFADGQTLLDPCCGSGSFLLSAIDAKPEQVFGMDNDPVAVMIAKINLLLKYQEFKFIPQIFCSDYLQASSSRSPQNIISRMKFSYIVTNPPWGAVSHSSPLLSEISSGETFSHFFVHAYKQLDSGGTIRFLFPESILNVKSHRDIRSFMLNNGRLCSINQYDSAFSGVTTRYVDIQLQKAEQQATVLVTGGRDSRLVDIKKFHNSPNCVFRFPYPKDEKILQIMRSKGRYSLINSIWALGIVTGDNKRRLSTICKAGYEGIYTGKEITQYVLKPIKNYILYDRSQMQQVAKEEYYRASEKLVYKFISNKLVFAYDDSGSLFLNSANILIPQIPNMSIKTVAAFLNSELFQFYYTQSFGEIKVLKGNLSELPFPAISQKQNRTLEMLVEKVLAGHGEYHQAIQSEISKIYGLSDGQISYIRSNKDGTAR